MSVDAGSLNIPDSLSRRRLFRQALVFVTSAAGLASLSSNAGLSVNSQKHLGVFERLADIILPRTATPSATDVNAHIFVMRFVTDAKGDEFTSRFFEGVNQFLDRLESRTAVQFNDISDDVLTAETKRILGQEDNSSSHWFIVRFKQLLVIGWALSEQTAESNFAYKGGLYQYLPSTERSQIIMGNYIDKEYLTL